MQNKPQNEIIHKLLKKLIYPYFNTVIIPNIDYINEYHSSIDCYQETFVDEYIFNSWHSEFYAMYKLEIKLNCDIYSEIRGNVEHVYMEYDGNMEFSINGHQNIALYFDGLNEFIKCIKQVVNKIKELKSVGRPENQFNPHFPPAGIKMKNAFYKMLEASKNSNKDINYE